jgi:hypothetical protein
MTMSNTALPSAIRARLEMVAVLVEPEMTLHVIQEDPDDDRVLECAVAAGRTSLGAATVIFGS